MDEAAFNKAIDDMGTTSFASWPACHPINRAALKRFIAAYEANRNKHPNHHYYGEINPKNVTVTIVNPTQNRANDETPATASHNP